MIKKENSKSFLKIRDFLNIMPYTSKRICMEIKVEKIIVTIVAVLLIGVYYAYTIYSLETGYIKNVDDIVTRSAKMISQPY